MQTEERDLITGLFDRLKSFEAQPRDPEADRLIVQSVSAQPAAPYLLVQTVLVQEQALKAAQAKIAELEAKAAAAPAPGFLASAPKIGPWGNASVPPTQPAPQPVQMAPQAPAYAPPAGGGFLRQALTTAAGVAGGALLFEGIRNMMGHGSAMASPQSSGLSSPDSFPDPSPLGTPMPPDRFSSADLAQDDGAADDYDTTDDAGGFTPDDTEEV
jgi:hypothetical protein